MPVNAQPFGPLPEPRFLMSPEGHRIATYTWGPDEAPTVLCVHGFASSCRDNWLDTGWIRALLDAGFRVLGVDQRGHGASDKPHDPADYRMDALVDDLLQVLDTYLVDDAAYLGYSLGARVGWDLTLRAPEHISRAVLGGIPDGRPLARLQVPQVRAFLDEGTPIADEITHRYVQLAMRLSSNDPRALMALAEGMQLGQTDPDPQRPPQQPVLFATGSKDPILEDSRRLAAAAPNGRFLEIPDRSHVAAPGSREFRTAGVAFLTS